MPLLDAETSVLRALAETGAPGVPGVLDVWRGGVALELIPYPTLRESEQAMKADAVFRGAAARALFGCLAKVHAAEDREGRPLAVVHGDLSPDNVFVAPGGAPAMLADFGLARWREGAAADGAFRGTLRYVAPEVARGEAFDGRADDFALAASILEIATGVPLRDGTSAAVLLAEAGTVPFDATHPWRAQAFSLFDRAIAEALLACLAFDPRDRPRETPRPW
jgi:serine/threonine protein kinase